MSIPLTETSNKTLPGIAVVPGKNATPYFTATYLSQNGQVATLANTEVTDEAPSQQHTITSVN